MIRAATASDAQAVAAIWNDAILNSTVTFNPDAKSVVEVADVIARTTPCLVSVVDGRVTGFARYFQFRGGAGYAQTAELTVMVAKGFRGMGTGRALVSALCDRALADGMHSIIAGCSAENPTAVKFHTQLGFQQLAVLPQVGFKFGRWIDLVLMQKMLR